MSCDGTISTEVAILRIGFLFPMIGFDLDIDESGPWSMTQSCALVRLGWFRSLTSAGRLAAAGVAPLFMLFMLFMQ